MIAVVCIGTIEPRAASAQQKLVKQICQLHDKNSDGRILKSEASGLLKSNFARIDQNQDDVLDEKELIALAKWLQGDRSPKKPEDSSKSKTTESKVKRISDIPYRDGNNAWKLDLVMPDQGLEKNVDTSRPAIVFVHGGAWRIGDKADGIWSSYPEHFAKLGYVCISVNYRFTNEAPFPACFEDCQCAVQWLRQNARKYNVDPNRIGAFGNSAGAHLVSLLGLSDVSKSGSGSKANTSSLVHAVVAAATPADFTNWSKKELAQKGKLLAGDLSTLDQRAEHASPAFQAHANAPPFLIIHGAKDELVPVSQGRALAKALKTTGAKKVTLKIFPDAGHRVILQHERQTLPMMEQFFQKHLKHR